MKLREGLRPELLVDGFDIGPESPDGFQPVTLATRRGTVECLHYPVPGAASAVVWIGGVRGDFDTPARGLYPKLCRELQAGGIASLRVRFRHPTDLDESTHDVLAGIGYLEREGVPAFGIVGHAFGGAVAIQAAALFEAVCTVVALATQSDGTDLVHRLAPRCSLLLVHGSADRVLPPSCSEQVYASAGGTKRLQFMEGAGHELDEAAEAVHGLVGDWLRANLGGRAVGS